MRASWLAYVQERGRDSLVDKGLAAWRLDYSILASSMEMAVSVWYEDEYELTKEGAHVPWKQIGAKPALTLSKTRLRRSSAVDEVLFIGYKYVPPASFRSDISSSHIGLIPADQATPL
ncbi:MAG: hypothetical protein ACP5MH_11845 [Thermoproteus sp.]